MLDDANSGWVYQIGDSIFDKVLLVNAEELVSLFSIYSSDVSVASDVSYNNSCSWVEKYDCIVLYLGDSEELSNRCLRYYIKCLNESGVLAVITANKTSIKNVLKINFVWNLLKYFTFKIIPDFTRLKYNKKCYHMQSVAGRIGEVFIKNGYKTIKNPFLLKQKLREIILHKYTYKIFSSDKLCLFSNTGDVTRTVVDNIILEVSSETGIKYDSIARFLVIPYKVLVTVESRNGDCYIFLLLRGREKNLRANNELEMLRFLNLSYPMLSPYLGESVATGVYKNVEYIVYRQLPGIIVDAYFEQFHRAERSAFNMLMRVGDMSRSADKINKLRFYELTNNWFDTLEICKKNDMKFSDCIEDFRNKIFAYAVNEAIDLVLFHGDYKIENILFDPLDYSIEGIIDWDLSEKISFPGLDLIYFIIYSHRVRENKSFTDVCENIFIMDGFNKHDINMIDEYCREFNISDKMFRVICALFIVHHYSCRERCDFSSEWVSDVLNNILNPEKIIK